MTMPRWLGLSAFLISLALWTSALCADGKLNVFGKFESDGRELVVATYATEDGKERVGLIAWASGKDRNSFALRLDEWGAIFDLWKKAAGAPAPQWQAVGTISETGTTDVSRIAMKRGPGVELAVGSPKGPAIAYVLPAAEFARFEQAMRDMKADLEEHEAKK
jgi:hypothetical protein